MENINEIHCYDDIINLPHHRSETRAHMPISDRAAQFAPFAALTGYDEAVKETARQTEDRTEQDEYERDVINKKLSFLSGHIDEKPEISVTYFKPDERKKGGAYITITGAVKKIDMYKGVAVMEDNTKINMDEIVFLESDFFASPGDEI